MDTPSEEVLKSARFISSSARHVSVDEKAIEKLAKKVCGVKTLPLATV